MASNYNYLLKPPVVAVKGGAATEIVRRQTLSDVFALDAVLAGVDTPSPAPSQPGPEHPVEDPPVTKPLKVAL